MDEQVKDITPVPERRRRRQRSKIQILKETYLPYIIAGLAVLLIIIFLIGSLSRSVAKRKAEKEASIQSSQEAENAAKKLREEAQQLLEQAEYLASGYDYEAAIAVLDSFSGDSSGFTEFTAKRAAYQQALSEMTAYEDISAIPNLSFHLLVVDPERAYVNAQYGSSYQNNFVTISEFEKILEQLYANGYMLVSPRDLVTTTTAEDGSTVYTSKTLYLPAGKKPVMLTETNTNYYTYMVDGDGDGLADKNGAGFASKLILDENGNLTNEYIDAQGNVLTGAYDLVPILDAFLAQHPDFSLRGAKATIAVSGYDGLFGYRTNSASREKLGASAYQAEVDGAKAVAEALRASGYEIACYSYRNMSYSDCSATEVEADIKRWNEEVVPILGQLDTFVFALNSDISDSAVYTGSKYETLKNAGFRFFIGASSNGDPWATVTEQYYRQKRLLVTGTNLISNPQYFTALFDAAAVLDAGHGK